MSAPAFKDINNIIKSIPGDVCGGTQPEFLYKLSKRIKDSIKE
jgi:hypothetical protein